MKSFDKKAPPYLFGERQYTLAVLKNHMGVYAPSIFGRKYGLKAVYILNLAKRIL